jgi:hypothetical protein
MLRSPAVRMRFGKLSCFAAVLLLSSSVSAQPKRKAKPVAPVKKEAPAKAEPAPADSAAAATTEAEKAPEKATDKPADKPAEEAPPSSATDLGEPPPKTTDKGASGTKLSPLTPEPGEFPTGGVAPPPVSYDKLLAQIASLRSRVAALTTTLYKSKLKVAVATEGDDAQIAGLVVTLDDGVVYTAPDRFSPEEFQTVYAHAVAPGHHVIGVEVERYDSRNREYRTYQTSKFTVIVPESRTLSATVVLEDESDMAEDFPDDQDGEYELGVKLRAQVEE